MRLFRRRRHSASTSSTAAGAGAAKAPALPAPVFTSTLVNSSTASVDMFAEVRGAGWRAAGRAGCGVNARRGRPPARQVNVPADVMFSLLSDPFKHESIFPAIEVGVRGHGGARRAGGQVPWGCTRRCTGPLGARTHAHSHAHAAATHGCRSRRHAECVAPSEPAALAGARRHAAAPPAVRLRSCAYALIGPNAPPCTAQLRLSNARCWS